MLHTKLADDSIGDLMELPVMDDRRVHYPIISPKDLKNGQDRQQDMQRDFNQVRDADTKASLHSQKGTGDEQGNADVVVPSDNKMNPLAGMSNQSENVRTKMQNTKNVSKVKYILPLLLGNQGPNNQFQALKLVSIIAQRRNLTLVLAPFFDHGPTVETQLPHTFEETLDPDILAQFVSVATMEEFERQCKRKADAVFLGTNMVINQTLSQTDQINSFVGQTIKAYYNWTGIKIPTTFLYMNRSDDVIQIHADLPYYMPVDDFLDKYPDSLTTSHQCNAFLYPYGYLGRLSYSQHISRYTKYFVRGKVVRENGANLYLTLP